MAMAIYSVLIGVGFAVVVWAVKEAEKNPAIGWRDIWKWIGVVLVVGVLPVSWLLVRESHRAAVPAPSAASSEGDFTFAAASEPRHFGPSP